MTDLRLLVVDGSPLAAWVITRLVPDDVRVITATSLQQARDVLVDDPPHAVILNLTPSRVSWRDVVELCKQRHPPIPFRCSSALDVSEWADSDLPCSRKDHFVKTIPVDEFKRVVLELVGEAQRLTANGENRAHARRRARDRGARHGPRSKPGL